MLAEGVMVPLTWLEHVTLALRKHRLFRLSAMFSGIRPYWESSETRSFPFADLTCTGNAPDAHFSASSFVRDAVELPRRANRLLIGGPTW